MVWWQLIDGWIEGGLLFFCPSSSGMIIITATLVLIEGNRILNKHEAKASEERGVYVV